MIHYVRGETPRRRADRAGSESRERNAIHIVSTRTDKTGPVPGQVQAAEKPNEITAAAQAIAAKHGGYTLALDVSIR
ncbi:MAG: hypothetical protein LBF78_15365 [Treponema sp.]|nr:hypothetical protein [Treponema sp.]